MSPSYCDQLRETMNECGLPTSPVVNRGDKAGLRFDAMDITAQGVTFLWLGKPVFIARRNQEELVHLPGEMVLDLH
jgi:hypothetical protein